MQRPHERAPTPPESAWMRVATHTPGAEFDGLCQAAGIPSKLPVMDTSVEHGRWFFGMLSDQAMADWGGVVAASNASPDLIMLEYLMTDTLQHYTSYKSELSHWIAGLADMALGEILARLRAGAS